MPARSKTIQELRRELAAKEKQLDKLLAQRRSLAARLAKLDKAIVAAGGEAPQPKARKARKRRKLKAAGRKAAPRRKAVKKTGRARSKPLVEYIKQVLGKSGKPLRAKEVMQAVRAAGYKTRSKDFYGIVASALRDTKTFMRVSRGVYTLTK